MAHPNPILRRQVVQLYKDLLNLGKEYPQGYAYFQKQLHQAFSSQTNLEDEREIRKGIEKAEFVKKEIEALYYLKRYRALRQRYDQA